MAGIQLVVELDDKGTPKIKKIEDEVSGLAKHTDKTGKKWKKSWSAMGRSVSSVQRKIRGMATSLPALIGAAGVAGSFAMLTKQGIGFNAQLESMETQFGVIVRDSDKAKRIMSELVKFSASTPFQLTEIAEAAKTLTAFGLEGTDTLRSVGDSAAAAQRPLQEVAMVFGRIKSGAFGEAFMRLAEMGLATRDMLEAEGLQFNRSGSYVGSVDDAMDAVFRIVNTRFSGMMERMSQTWNGAWSTMNDNFTLFVGEMTRPLFEKLKPRISELTDIFKSWKSNGAFRAAGIEIAKWVDKAVGKILELMRSSDTLVRWFYIARAAVSGFFGAMAAGAKWVAGVVSAIFRAIRDDIIVFRQSLANLADPRKWGEVGSNFASAGGDWGAVSAAASADGFRARWLQMSGEISRLMSTTFSFDVPEDPGGEGDWESNYQRRSEGLQNLLDHMADLEAQHMAMMKDMWRRYYEEMIDVGAVEFMDAFATTILDKHTSLKENLALAWRQMKQVFVRTAFEMAAGYIASQIKMAITKKALDKAALAEELVTSRMAAVSQKSQAGAAASAGAAKYHMAYAAIPFLGPSLAAAAVAAMNAQILASQAAASVPMFRTGGFFGAVPGSGSGVEDSYLARLSPGEYTHQKSAVDFYGKDFMDDVNNRTFVPDAGARQEVHIHFGETGNSEFERDVEEQLVPVIERLFRQRRLRFA